MPIKFIRKYLNLTKNETYFVFTVFIFVGSLLGFTFYGPNFNGTASSVDFNIPQGASFNSVVIDLHEKNIISNKFNLKMTAFLFGVEKNIKAGQYDIPDGISYVNLLRLFNTGVPKNERLVTIQEGIWQTDLADLLESELNINAKEILKLSSDKNFLSSLGLEASNLEGYLLPETYYFYTGTTAEQILRKLNSEMNVIFEDTEIIRQMQILGMTKSEILIMASIIDGESNKISEFKRISGVYHNRLRNNWKLQADPTVQYLIRQRRKKVNKVYLKDLEIDSKFNTYMYYGLPPAPINNPGKDAIIAALYPEQHDLFFFVADGNGGHLFSKTSREHQNNVNRYRDWRRQNNQ